MLAIVELMRLTGRELGELEIEFLAQAAVHPDGTPERSVAMTNLQNIRFARNRSGLAP
jgi:hypothetical protein